VLIQHKYGAKKIKPLDHPILTFLFASLFLWVYKDQSSKKLVVFFNFLLHTVYFLGKKVPIFKAPAIAGDGPVATDFLQKSLVEKKKVVSLFYIKSLTFLSPIKLLFQHLLQFIESNIAPVRLYHRPINNSCCLVLYIKSKKKYYQHNDPLIMERTQPEKRFLLTMRPKQIVLKIPMPTMLGKVSNYLILNICKLYTLYF